MLKENTHIVGDDVDWKRSVHGKDTMNFSDPKISFVTKRCKDKTVLDLGCVQHTKTAYLNKNWLHKSIRAVSSKVVGLDLYKEGVEALQLEGYDVIHGDAQSFKLAEKFDVIVAGDLIEHLTDFDGFFTSINDHLLENGQLIIATPNPWHWKRVARACIGQQVPVNPEHTSWFCPETIRLIAKRFGFEMISYEYGSERLKDRLIPLPKTCKHQTFYAELRRIG